MEEVVLRVGDRVVRALRAGPAEGELTLFLHGNPDTADLWGPVMARLPHRRCLALDLPGFGGSDLHEGRPSLAAMAAWVDGALAAAGEAGPVAIVAHDFGGPYAIAWAVSRRERVARIALTNTIFFPGLRWHRWARVWRTPVLGELATRLTTRAVFRAELRRGGPGLTDAHVDGAWARITPRTHRAVLALYRSTDPRVFDAPSPTGASWYAAWRTLAAEVPSLTLWGLRDPYLRAAWRTELGTASLADFPDAGHWLPAEDPDGFTARLAAFLDGR